MRVLYKISWLFACVLTATYGHAQQRELDSLLTALSNHPQNDTIKLNLLNDIAFDYRSIDPAQGLIIADQAITLAKKLNHKLNLALAYTYKAHNYSELGKYNEALKLYKQVMEMCRQMGHQRGIAKTLGHIGIIYSTTSNYSEALNYHLKALAILNQLGNQTQLPYVLNSIGLNYMRLSNYPKALDYYLKALSIAEQQGDKNIQAGIFSSLGLVYTRLEAYDKALAYHTKALRLNEQLDNKSDIAFSLSNIAAVYGSMNEERKALKQYQKALLINRAIKNKSSEATDLLNIGISYTALTDYPRALPPLQQALQLYKELGIKKEMSLTIDELATIYRQAPDWLLRQQGISPANRYATAIHYHKWSIQLAEETKALDRQSEQWENLSKTYAAQKNFADALKAYKQHITLRDSVVTTEQREDIARKEVQFKFEKKEAVARAEYAKKQAISVAEIRQQRIVNNSLMGGAGVLAVAGAAGFVLYKRKREADEQTKEAELKAEIADTEMKALRAQMNPHFIFNSLNSISDYVLKNDTKTADYYLTKFAKLMRLILENSEKKQVTLADDLQALELYMQLEALRMQHRFTYEIRVDDALDPDETLIPPLLLQPFVENSIWHGLAWKEGIGKITVHILKEGEMINCVVEDNGVGRKQSEAAKTGSEIAERKSLGMKITNARIAILNQERKQVSGHGDVSTVTLSDLTEGTRVEVKLPLELSF